VLSRSLPTALRANGREVSVGIAILALALVLAVVAPAYFATDNLRDLFLANLPVLIVALGASLVMLTGEIDISVGSVFAICGVTAGLIAKLDLPVAIAALGACLVGAALASINGALVAFARIPSIVVTLASMVALRDALRWTTQGAWVQDLPAGFQWAGLTQVSFPIFTAGVAVALCLILSWVMRNVAIGRALYATGSNRDAARLAGFDTSLIIFGTFAFAGALTGLAATLNAVRFNQIPSNAGIGLEMKVVAAVVVGGTAITGGRGTLVGTILGVVLLGAIGPALTFLGVSPQWERAVQGAIILTAAGIDAIRGRVEAYHAAPLRRTA
jgi:rhamnose transport system permease protein